MRHLRYEKPRKGGTQNSSDIQNFFARIFGFAPTIETNEKQRLLIENVEIIFLIFDAVRIFFEQIFKQRDAFVIAQQRAVRIAEIRQINRALHVFDFQISLRELVFEFRVVARVLGEIVEIFDGIFDHHFTRGSRARKIGDRVVIFENDAARKLSDLFETFLGAGAFGVCDSRLIKRCDQTRNQSREN